MTSGIDPPLQILGNETYPQVHHIVFKHPSVCERVCVRVFKPFLLELPEKYEPFAVWWDESLDKQRSLGSSRFISPNLRVRNPGTCP